MYRHIEGQSTAFGTALNYTALRILGVSAEHPVCVKARGTLHKLGTLLLSYIHPQLIFFQGGATTVPSWGKFWLSVLNVYEWEGQNPIPPELLYVSSFQVDAVYKLVTYQSIGCRILPEWLPFHPYRWWIHTRTVFVPMSYLYGIKFKAPEDELILSLREVCIHCLHFVLSFSNSSSRRNCIPNNIIL
jgi:lanosterol synthase